MLRCASVLISLTAKSGWKSSKRQGILPPFHQVPAVPGKNSNSEKKVFPLLTAPLKNGQAKKKLIQGKRTRIL